MDRFDPGTVAQFENATWSRCASTYMHGFGALAAEAITPLLDGAKVSKGSRILDVGTGPGLVAAAAAQRGASAVGIDFSDAVVAEARRLHPNADFRQAAADDLPFEDGQFDAVVGNFVLHHLAQPSVALGESIRVLRSGGSCAFTVWGDLAKLEAFGLFLGAVQEFAGSVELPHGPLFGVSDFSIYDRMLGEVGLRDTSVAELPIAWRTSSIDSFIESFRNWADLGTFPPLVAQQIEDAVRQRSVSFRSGSLYVMPNPAILLCGTK